MDKSELITFIVRANGTAHSHKKDKLGGAIWKPTAYGNLILAKTMDAFDLLGIQTTTTKNAKVHL